MTARAAVLLVAALVAGALALGLRGRGGADAEPARAPRAPAAEELTESGVSGLRSDEPEALRAGSGSPMGPPEP